MSWNRFIFKSHKWLAVGIGLLTLIWFVSGIVMVTPMRLFGEPPPLNTEGAAGPDYRQIAVSVPQAIAVVEDGLGREVKVTGVEFRRLAGRLLYRLQVQGAGSHLVDAVSGERFIIDEAAARALLRLADPAAAGGEMALLREFDSDYRIGPLPAYRLTLADSGQTKHYLAVETGEVRTTNAGVRWRNALAGLHTLNFLRPLTDARSHRLLLAGLSAIGTLMSVFGLAILWIQFLNWRARRRMG